MKGERCGFEVRSNLDSILTDVEHKFTRDPMFTQGNEQRRVCEALHNFQDNEYYNVWDITGLGMQYPFFGVRGDQFTASTAKFNGKCFARGAINYALFGKMQHLCIDRFSEPWFYSLAATRVLITAYRAFRIDVRPNLLYPRWQHAFREQVLVFGDYGYTRSFSPNGSELDADCSLAGPEPAWTWTWAGHSGP